jgi:hypothetical protein
MCQMTILLTPDNHELESLLRLLATEINTSASATKTIMIDPHNMISNPVNAKLGGLVILNDVVIISGAPLTPVPFETIEFCPRTAGYEFPFIDTTTFDEVPEAVIVIVAQPFEATVKLPLIALLPLSLSDTELPF